MTTPIDYILQLEKKNSHPDLPLQTEFKEVMHGTPDLVVAWLKHMPNFAKTLFVMDSEASMVVTAPQYIERYDSGATSYPNETEQPRELRNFSEWVR